MLSSSLSALPLLSSNLLAKYVQMTSVVLTGLLAILAFL